MSVSFRSLATLLIAVVVLAVVAFAQFTTARQSGIYMNPPVAHAAHLARSHVHGPRFV